MSGKSKVRLVLFDVFGELLPRAVSANSRHTVHATTPRTGAVRRRGASPWPKCDPSGGEGSFQARFVQLGFLCTSQLTHSFP